MNENELTGSAPVLPGDVAARETTRTATPEDVLVEGPPDDVAARETTPTPTPEDVLVDGIGDSGMARAPDEGA